MRLRRSVVLFAVSCVLLTIPAAFRAAADDQPASGKRALQFTDAAAWKNLRFPVIAEVGDWFAYRLTPAEGDSTVVIRQTNGDKQYEFPIGEVIGPAPGGPPALASVASATAIAISSDSKYAAFMMFPTHAEAAQLKRQKKPLQSRVGIVNLDTGEKTEVAKIRRFALSNENGAWIALQRYGPDTPGAGPRWHPASGGSRGRAGPRDDKPKGSDLLLRELATGQEINIGNVSEFAFDKHGRLSRLDHRCAGQSRQRHFTTEYCRWNDSLHRI